MTTLWDTTGSDVVKALAAERRAAGALAFGLALTLVAVVDEKNVREAEAAATQAASAHPCRLLLVVRRQIDAPHPRLDAEVSIGGRLGPGEAVVMRMSGRLALHAESVVLPLLAPDAPVVTWWHDEPPVRIAHDPLGVFADRRVTDVSRAPDPLAALTQRATDFAPGDTDVAWTRLSPWRTLLAAAFDAVSDQPTAVTISAGRSNPSAQLFAGWLRNRLGVAVTVRETGGDATIGGVAVELGSDRLAITRTDAHSATIARSGYPDRVLPLVEGGLGELLAEELRRLDDDVTFAEALGTWSNLPNLAGRNPHREHIWRDPMQHTPVPAGVGAATAAAPTTPAAPSAPAPTPPSAPTTPSGEGRPAAGQPKPTQRPAAGRATPGAPRRSGPAGPASRARGGA
ncbi:glucose-6-phosphate dehydrogenase assembly protein OpcA [Frankia sp. Ag45/Mut15]|uniref:Glucose-6-phosphate dehydrogenase assembly protein OpcA n=1 Tax=Frankia umida TaxID=573489 RepID=A0ABT0JYG4_9ACTN|nr:glucose-6-phosphate dehydrogenase assembly protein OpcA [Frankia umida]MCK9876587.1 glucose-6-phosphate dehydrogenase assembly protein OpcA [Frankia umida]